MTSLNEHLENHEIILLDGAVSTEIQRRGVAMDSDVWSGLAHRTHPEVVRQVHEDYIRAGAQVITANTYSTARHVLESIDLGSEVKVINAEAVQLTKAARDNVAKDETWIAGSMSSMAPFNSPQEVAVGEKVADNYQELAEILAEAGVDLIIAEMMRDAVNAKLVIKAALSTGLPVWIGYSAMCSADGKSVLSWRWKNVKSSSQPDNFEELVEAITPLGGDAAGVMHSQVRDTGPALEILSRHWSGPKLAYAETGELEKPNWNYKEICAPENYAAEIEDWINSYGVQIVGGCCGTGPEHIRMLKKSLPKHLPKKLKRNYNPP
ncbi:MAG: homocysteine S-methyltransferase family protein [SAR324 cluster bacterium]|nr:homocysteine S-methyltransferase family protein [SAR324 cluster bacterium]HIO11861.1 homocysteine S-methyltransferase family protein [Deltaproteobacteria bacterium]